MAHLVFIPQQISVGSTDITLDSYEVLYDIKVPKEVHVEHEFLLMEFDESKFASFNSSNYLAPDECLWLLAKIKQFDIPKIAYYYSYNKGKQSLNFYVPEQFGELLKKLLNNIGFFVTSIYFLEKEVDDEKKTIHFKYSH